MIHGDIHSVLVIDDDPDMLALIEVVLSDFGGLATILCQTAEDGMAQLEEMKPDAILLDLYLPEAEVRETLSRIRANPDARHIPVVILTAELDDGKLGALRALQISGVIKKPFDSETLAEEVRRLCSLH